MSTATRLIFAVVLAGVAAVLLGYTAWVARERVAALEAQVASLNDQLAQAYQPDLSFYHVLADPDMEALLTSLVASEDRAERDRIANEVYSRIDGLPAQFPDGFLVHRALFAAAEETDILERGAMRDVIVDVGTRKLNQVVPIDEAFVSVDSKTIGAVSGLVTAIGGFGSGLGAFLLFVMGGDRRKIEDEMLALELEMKRVDLAKAQFAARDALDATRTG